MNKNKGFTIIEMIMGVALASIVMLGLVVVYMIGVDAWEKTSYKINLQRTASHFLYRVTKDIQRADSVEILDGGTRLYCRIPAFDPESPVKIKVYYLKEEQLMLEEDGESNIVLPFEERDSISLKIDYGKKLFKYTDQLSTTPNERVVEINFILTHERNTVAESMIFTSVVGARNL